MKASGGGEELAYSVNFIDSAVQRPNNANNSTTMFAPAEFPLASPFWSLTMYELPFSPSVSSPPNYYRFDGP